MAYTSRVLVVTRQTADSDDLLAALKARAERSPIDVTVLMPAPEIGMAGREAGKGDLDRALEKMRAAGLSVEGMVGDHHPVEAVLEAWKPGAYDEIIVATLPGATSKWMRMDFPHTVARLCDAPVTHVVARPPGHEDHPSGPPPKHERSPLGPLGVLSWSQPRR